MQRWGTNDPGKRATSASWTVDYGSLAVYANNRLPKDGLNEAGLTARTNCHVEGDRNQSVAPDDDREKLDEDRWGSFVLDRFATVAEAADAIRDEIYVDSVTGEAGSGFSDASDRDAGVATATGLMERDVRGWFRRFEREAVQPGVWSSFSPGG